MSFVTLLRRAHFYRRGLGYWIRMNSRPWRKPRELRALQQAMFKSVLQHAYHNTAFYRRRYHQHGVHLSDVTTLDDICKLPIVTKHDLRQTPLHDRVSSHFRLSECQEWRTSGTTGEPFRSYMEPEAISYLGALWLRRLLIYGCKPWYTIVTCGPFWASGLPSLKTKRFIPSLLNMLDPDGNRLLLADDLAENISVLRSLNPEVIWSPPSYLRLLAQTIVNWGITGIRPKILICGAEMLDPETRTLIESTFGVPVFNEYGTVDIASRAIAWECERHTGFHINMDAIFLECVDEQGEPVSPGEEGNLVATNLFRYATPMIRYKIGDVGIFSDQPCPCGRQFALIQSIVGRSDDFIVLSNGRWISPFSAMRVCHDVPGVKQYQIVQETPNRMTIFLEPTRNGDDVTAAIRAKCTTLFGPQLQVDFVIGPVIQPQGKKIRTVTSKVSASQAHIPMKK